MADLLSIYCPHCHKHTSLTPAPVKYKNGDDWVDIYSWETIEDAQLSNERMAGNVIIKTRICKGLFSFCIEPSDIFLNINNGNGAQSIKKM